MFVFWSTSIFSLPNSINLLNLNRVDILLPYTCLEALCLSPDRCGSPELEITAVTWRANIFQLTLSIPLSFLFLASFFSSAFGCKAFIFQSHFLCGFYFQLFTTSIYSRDNPFLFSLFNTLLVIPNRQWFFPLNRAPVAEETNLKSYLLRFSIQPLLLCFTFCSLHSQLIFSLSPISCFLNKQTSQLEFCASRWLPLSPLSTLQVSFLFSGQSSQTFQHEVNF